MNVFYKCRLCGEDFNRIEMVTFERDGSRSPPLGAPICPHCGEVYQRPPPVLREVPSPGSASSGSGVWVDTSGPAAFAVAASKDRVPLFIPGETVWLNRADEEPPKPPESDEARLARWADFRAGRGLPPLDGVEDSPERERIRELAKTIITLPRPSGFGSWCYVSEARWRAFLEGWPRLAIEFAIVQEPTNPLALYVASLVQHFEKDRWYPCSRSDLTTRGCCGSTPAMALSFLYSHLATEALGRHPFQDGSAAAVEYIRLAAETLDGGPIRVKVAWKMPAPPEPGLVPWASTASEEAVELFWAPASYPHPGDLEGVPTDPYEWYTEELGRPGSAVADALEIAWPFATEFCEDVTHFKALGFRLHS